MSLHQDARPLDNDIFTPPSVELPKRKDVWDKTDVVGKLLGAIAIPFGLTMVGYLASAALQDRTAKDKTNEIAITVLQSKDPGIPELKAWARQVFDQMVTTANQQLPPGAKKELSTTTLPSVPSVTSDPVADLESEDATTRRNARVTLAELGPEAIAKLLVNNRTNPDYRQVLGAIVALTDMPQDARCKAYRTILELRDDVSKHGGINEKAMNKAVAAALVSCP